MPGARRFSHSILLRFGGGVKSETAVHPTGGLITNARCLLDTAVGVDSEEENRRAAVRNDVRCALSPRRGPAPWLNSDVLVEAAAKSIIGGRVLELEEEREVHGAIEGVVGVRTEPRDPKSEHVTHGEGTPGKRVAVADLTPPPNRGPFP